jgi:DNA-binding protein H-NS
MESDINDLIAQRDALEKTISQLQKSRREIALAEARNLIADFALTRAELFAGKPAGARKGKKIQPKYRHPSGVEWSGRGNQPVWLRTEIARGRSADEFLVKRT